MPDAVKPGVTDRTAFWLGFRAAAVVAFAVAAAVLLRHQSLKTPLVHGDAWEYWYQTESFRRHGTPELRPEVQKAVGDEASRWGLSSDPQPPYAYAVTPTGRWYGVHFWAYALSVVPAAEYLHLTGGTVLIAPGLANAGWFVLAIGFVLFGSAAPPGQRLALAGLAAVGPVLWYLSWPGAEVFSWALALVSVAAYRDRRYGLAGLAAGLASTQNPPVAFLGAAAVLAAAWERDWRSTVVAFAGSAVSLVPFAFYLHHFGKPNLIAAEFATANSISWARTWGLATDLNQGLFPYAPLLVVGAVAGAVRLAVLGRVRGLLLVGAGLAMVVGVQVAHNWNSDGVGVQRYLVWMIPVAAGVAVEGLGGRRAVAFAAVAVVTHAVVLYGIDRTQVIRHGYLTHTAIAEWALTHHPQLYAVEPEVFVERQRHKDDWPHTPSELPIGFATPDGEVKKLLLDAESVERIGQRYEVDPEYLSVLRERAAGESGLFYAHPPAGAVRARSPAAVAGPVGTKAEER